MSKYHKDRDYYLEEKFAELFLKKYGKKIGYFFEPEKLVNIDGKEFIIDYFYSRNGAKLAIEQEGRTKFSISKDKHNQHTVRHNALVNDGYEVLYFTADHIKKTPEVDVWPVLNKKIVSLKEQFGAQSNVNAKLDELLNKKNNEFNTKALLIALAAIVFITSLIYFVMKKPSSTSIEEDAPIEQTKETIESREKTVEPVQTIQTDVHKPVTVPSKPKATPSESPTLKKTSPPTTSSEPIQKVVRKTVLFNEYSKIYHDPTCPIAKTCKNCVQLSEDEAITLGGRASKICDIPD